MEQDTKNYRHNKPYFFTNSKDEEGLKE
ncbi:urease accessory protein UreG, partial [Bacillus tropicus]|nr:urease accessory protein UreG [Bacillus tropicus]